MALEVTSISYDFEDGNSVVEFFDETSPVGTQLSLNFPLSPVPPGSTTLDATESAVKVQAIKVLQAAIAALS